MPRRRVLLAAALGMALAVPPASASAQAVPTAITVSAKVKSSIGYPLTVGQYDKVKVIADVQQRFESVTRICWSFYSTPEDPLAYNDTMALTTLRDVHLLTIFHYGDWQPVNTYCNGYRLQKFRDGREPTYLWGGRAYGYDNGAATFREIRVEITGVPAP
jgi:hypothetical protein